MDKKTSVGILKSNFPILDWLPHHALEWLRFDMIAAPSIWAPLMPQGVVC